MTKQKDEALTGRVIEVLELRCNRCGAKFFPILEMDGEIKLPMRCRNRPCSSPYWNRQRVRKRKELVAVAK